MENKSKEIKRKKVDWLLSQPIETQLELISHHMEICRLMINSIIEQEVSDDTGQRYSHDKPHNKRFCRWGFNPGRVSK